MDGEREWNCILKIGLSFVYLPVISSGFDGDEFWSSNLLRSIRVRYPESAVGRCRTIRTIQRIKTKLKTEEESNWFAEVWIKFAWNAYEKRRACRKREVIVTLFPFQMGKRMAEVNECIYAVYGWLLWGMRGISVLFSLWATELNGKILSLMWCKIHVMLLSYNKLTIIFLIDWHVHVHRNCQKYVVSQNTTKSDDFIGTWGSWHQVHDQLAKTQKSTLLQKLAWHTRTKPKNSQAKSATTECPKSRPSKKNRDLRQMRRIDFSPAFLNKNKQNALVLQYTQLSIMTRLESKSFD